MENNMQRPGKTHKAAMGSDSHDMRMYTFFKIAKEVLEKEGHSDGALYFEQLEDHLASGKSLPTNHKEVSRLLGV
jgi:hypothetical protein